MTKHRDPILEGIREASALHEYCQQKNLINMIAGRIDIINIVNHKQVFVIFKKLKNILGCCIHNPEAGIMITTERSSSIQRFTLAHELGHIQLNHNEDSYDDESIIENDFGFQTVNRSSIEVAATSFANEFLMPKTLIINNLKRMGLKSQNEITASHIYNASLHMGVSYTAACWGMLSQKILSSSKAEEFAKKSKKKIKEEILNGTTLENYHPDVWRISKDFTGYIHAGPEDVIVLEVNEQSSGGYIWDIEMFKQKGFKILSEEQCTETERTYGASRKLKIVVQNIIEGDKNFYFHNLRPWERNNVAEEIPIVGSFYKEKEGIPNEIKKKKLGE